MLKMKRLIIIIGLTALLCTAVSLAYAAPVGFKTWPLKTISDANKVWSIKFNMPLKPDTVNSDTIYIVDQNGSRLTATLSLSSDKTEVKVIPSAPYSLGKEYKIYITSGVASAQGNYLAQPIIVPFKVIEANNKIISVSSTYTSFITSVTVITSYDVYKVTANSKEMHYEGDNVYTIGLSGLKPGSTVNIYAYDASGKLVGNIKHTIQ